MKFDNIGTTYPYSSSDNTQTTKQIKEIQDTLAELSNSLKNLAASYNTTAAQTRDNSANIGLLTTRISQTETELNNYASSFTTENLSANNASLVNISSNKIISDRFQWRDGINVTSNQWLSIPKGSIVYANTNTGAILINYSDNGNATVINGATEEIKYSVSDNLLINILNGASFSYISQGEVGATSYSGNYTVLNQGTTVIGDFYAILGRDYNFDNITVINTVTADKVLTEKLGEPKLSNVDNRVKNAYIENATIENINTDNVDAKKIDSESLETNKLNTKIDVLNRGYITIPQHQSNEFYYIEVPTTNGNWQIELTSDDHNEHGFKATIQKVDGSAVVVYRRDNEAALSDILVGPSTNQTESLEKSLYFKTWHSGKVYFSYQALKETDTTIKTYFQEELDITNFTVYDVTKDENVIIFGNAEFSGDITVNGQIIANGDYDSVFTDIYIKNNIYLEDIDDYGAKHWNKGESNQVIRVDETSKEPTWQDTVISTSGGAIQTRNELITEGVLAGYNGTVGKTQYTSRRDTAYNLYNDFDASTSNWYKTPALQEKITNITRYKDNPGNLLFNIYTEAGKVILFDHKPTDVIEYRNVISSEIHNMEAGLFIAYLTSSLDFSAKIYQQGAIQIKDNNGNWQTIIGRAEIPDIYLYNEKFTDGKSLWTTENNHTALSIPVVREGYDGSRLIAAFIDNNKKLVGYEAGLQAAESGQTITMNYPSWWNKIDFPEVTHNEVRFVKNDYVTNFGTAENPDYGTIKSVMQPDSNVLSFTFTRNPGNTYTQEEWDSGTPLRLTGIPADIILAEFIYTYWKETNTNTNKISYYTGSSSENNFEYKISDINVYKQDLMAEMRLTNISRPQSGFDSPECYEDIKYVKVIFGGEEGRVYYLRGKNGKFYQTGVIYISAPGWYILGPNEVTEEEYNTNSGIPGDTYTLEIYWPIFYKNLIWDNTEEKTQITSYYIAADGSTALEYYLHLTPRDYNLSTHVSSIDKEYIKTTYAIFFSNNTVEYLQSDNSYYTIYEPVPDAIVWTPATLTILNLYQKYDKGTFYLQQDKTYKIENITPTNTVYTYTMYNNPEHTGTAVQDTINGTSLVQWFSSSDTEHENPIVDTFDNFAKYLETDPDCSVQFPLGGYIYVVIDSVDSGSYTITTSHGEEVIEYNADITVYTLSESYVDNYPITHLGDGTQVHGSLSVERLNVDNINVDNIDADSIKNKYFYVGGTLTPDELAEFDDNALIIMGD